MSAPARQARSALERAETLVAGGAPLVHVTGPRGAGKTALLAALAGRLAADGRARVLRAEAPASAAGACAELAAALERRAGGDPVAALLAASRDADPARPLVALLDDADALAGCEAARLRDLAEASGGTLRFVLAAGGAAPHGAPTWVGMDPRSEVRLDGRLPLLPPPALRAPWPVADPAAATVATGSPWASSEPAPPPATASWCDAAPEPRRAGRGRRGGLLVGLAVASLLAALGAGVVRWQLAAPPEAPATAATARAAVPALPAPPAAPALVRVGINASPWARIELDGRPLGVTPLGAVAVPEGVHRFRARMADGRVLEQRVEIAPERRHVVFR